jgi:hypothetical protein
VISSSYSGPILCPLCQQTGQTCCTHKDQSPEKLAALADARAGSLKCGVGRSPIYTQSSRTNSEWTPARIEWLLKLGLYGGAAALVWFCYTHLGSGVGPQESTAEELEAEPGPEEYTPWEPEL